MKQGDPIETDTWFSSGFIRCHTFNVGYPHDQELAKRYLILGKLYTVKMVKVWPSSSEVEVNEIPGIWFNTLFFEGIEN